MKLITSLVLSLLLFSVSMAQVIESATAGPTNAMGFTTLTVKVRHVRPIVSAHFVIYRQDGYLTYMNPGFYQGADSGARVVEGSVPPVYEGGSQLMTFTQTVGMSSLLSGTYTWSVSVPDSWEALANSAYQAPIQYSSMQHGTTVTPVFTPDLGFKIARPVDGATLTGRVTYVAPVNPPAGASRAQLWVLRNGVFVVAISQGINTQFAWRPTVGTHRIKVVALNPSGVVIGATPEITVTK